LGDTSREFAIAGEHGERFGAYLHVDVVKAVQGAARVIYRQAMIMMTIADEVEADVVPQLSIKTEKGKDIFCSGQIGTGGPLLACSLQREKVRHGVLTPLRATRLITASARSIRA